ncbi:MAG TPA: M3 family metallopeptidase [Vicinamibacteria bacterium]|nr:M3 family metallopeptidase [Vicinamibacteria bacterium]
MTDTNPLLRPSTDLPRFDLIGVAHVEPGILALVSDVERLLEELEASLEPGSARWETVVEPIEKLHDRLGFGFGMVEHLMSVRNSAALREAYEKVEPSVVRLRTRIGQSEPIYRALVELRERESATLDPTRKRIVDKLIEEAELAGVALQGEPRERFQAIQLELADLSTKFSNHLLDATKLFDLVLESREDVTGLPKSFLEMSAQSARAAGRTQATGAGGPWRVTLDGPSFTGFMKHSRRRDLREKLYRAYITRASSGELDNSPLIDKILSLRQEEARLLGFDTYAALSLSRKMAGSVDRAEHLLEELRVASHEAGEGELRELQAFMREKGAEDEARSLQHWDVAFWSERLREARFDYREEELRPYFPMPRVLEGLFGLAHRLFGIQVVEDPSGVPVWHEDVRFFRVRALDGEDLAAFYLDPYSRPQEKRGGAWMNEVVGKSRLFPRLPTAHLVCNGSPPVDGRPSLMTFREIETLFHEFGHALQHMLTSVDDGLASGIRNVEWDAVELPSQFMENWCYHRDTLVNLSQHVETGEALPDDVFEKIRASRTFHSGLMTLRQLYFGFIDLELHHRYEPTNGSESPLDVQRRIGEKTLLLAPIPEDRFLCGFAHIFAGGYAAGYYSYKWAEVLSADAFAAFEEAGLDLDASIRETGRRFRETVLALGGSAAPLEVFRRFRGREPTTEALLRHSGLAA